METTSGPLARRERKARRGQAAVLIAMVLFSLVLFMAMATNVGIVINDKVRMQNTADLATYSAAYTEAQVLNQLTFINTQIATTVENCRATLVGVPWVSCLCTERHPAAEAIIMACQGTLDGLIATFIAQANYGSSVMPALGAGRAAANANFANSSSKTSFMEDLPGSPTAIGTYNINASLNFGGSMTLPAIANFSQAQITFNYEHWVFCPCQAGCCYAYTSYPSTQAYAWFWKSERQPTVWVEGRVYGAPRSQYFDIAYGSGSDGGFFGASSTSAMAGQTARSDLLYAYAVAKPYEGSVGPTRLGYTDRNGIWMRGMLYMPGPMGMSLDERNDLGMVEEYRARLAGMEESLSGSSNPLNLAVLDGARLGMMWNRSYFNH